MSEAWKVGDLAGLPAKELPELPRKPWSSGTQPSKEELVKWKKAATRIHEKHARDRSKRIATDIKLHIANRMRNERSIYFVWNMDWRGRMYPVQQFVNPQSDDSGRALLEFAEGKPIGPDGAFWLAVHGANSFGFDKSSFEERVNWVIEHEQEILATATDPMGMTGFWGECDSPFQFLAFCFEWGGYREKGDAYVSHLPVSLDGSCNGLQNFSAMLRDEVGGKATNLVPAETPNDIYQEVAEVLGRKVEADAKTDPLALPWVGKVTRKITKRGVMTTPYGVTRFGLRKQLQYEVEKIDKNYLGVAMPGPHYGYLSGRLYESIGEVVIAARSAMAWLQEVAQVISKCKETTAIRWTTPVGFKPVQDYRKQKLIRVQTLHGGIMMNFGLWADTPKVDKRKMQSGIAPNFVHSLDAAHCMSTVNKCRDFGINNFSMVHDSYGTLAADVGRLAYYLRETFIEQYTGDVLQEFHDEVKAQLPPELAAEIPPPPPKGGLDLTQVRRSRYFFA
jgi:DNA-directed RNA polymerase